MIPIEQRNELLATAYQTHARAVSTFTSRLCGDMAEDVIQDVFVHLWLHPERFDPERGTMLTYLLGVARNRSLDLLRSSDSRSRRESRVAAFPTAAPSGPEAVVETMDDAAHVRAAVDALPDHERMAIITAYYGRCTYREAAIVLGVAEGTVKSRIRVALQRLAIALNSSPPEAAAGLVA